MLVPERTGPPDFLAQQAKLRDRVGILERHRHPGGDEVAAAIASSAAISADEFDAVVDASLTESDPTNRMFIGIGEALTYLRVTAGLTERANVLVRRRSPTGVLNAYIETGNITAPDHVFLWCQPGAAPSPVAEQFGVLADITWDHANFTMTAVTWEVHGLNINVGGNKTTLFNGRVRLVDCFINGGQSVLGSVGSSGDSVLIRCWSWGPGWWRFTEAYDCKFRVYFPGTYNPGESTLLFRMLDCEVNASTLQGNPVTWQLNATRTDIRLLEHWNGGGFMTMSLGASSGRYLIVNNDVSAAITITNPANAYRVDLRGFFQAVTVAAPQTNNYAHSLDIGCTSLDVTGPAMLDCHVQQGTITIRGTRVSGHISHIRSASSGAAVTFVGASRARLDVTSDPSTSSGTYKPYSFDASCVANLLVMTHPSGLPAVGTDAGSFNVVLPYAIEDEGVFITKRSTFNFVGAGVTVTDAGGKNVITIPGAGISGHTIEDEGVPLTQRATMNFVGAGVTATDAGGETVVTIPGGGGSVTFADPVESQFSDATGAGTGTDSARSNHIHDRHDDAIHFFSKVNA